MILIALGAVVFSFAVIIRDAWRTYDDNRPEPAMRSVRVIPAVYDWEREGAA